MTGSGLVEPSPREPASREGEGVRVVACAFCRRRLADEFFFTCRTCGASCCYIHMSRHRPPTCARQVREVTRHDAVADGKLREEEARAGGDVPLILAGSKPRGASSANV